MVQALWPSFSRVPWGLDLRDEPQRRLHGRCNPCDPCHDHRPDGSSLLPCPPEWKLRRAFGTFLMFVSVLMVLKFYLPYPVVPSAAGQSSLAHTDGVSDGFPAGLMGVGGGALMIVAMVLIGGYNQHMAQGSALLAIIPAGWLGPIRTGDWEYRGLSAQGPHPGFLQVPGWADHWPMCCPRGFCGQFSRWCWSGSGFNT